MRKKLKISPKNIVRIAIVAGIILSFWIYFMVPRPLFEPVYSTILESSDGQLMGARIASDGQWRFPEPDSIPTKFEKCLIYFEDRHFYRHNGINPASMTRALVQNIKSGRIVSGGSTLTMQLARLARTPGKRNIGNKLMEMVWAWSIEKRYPKKEILMLYAAHAPFGGNVVGLEAASWRYYQRPPQQLSWGESATLAVLPNAPALIFPGKNDRLLMQKRNRLLDKLVKYNILDSLSCSLAKLEPLPEQIYRLPDESYHLLETAIRENKGERIRTTLNLHLQRETTRLLSQHVQKLSGNNIFNAAAIVGEVKTGKVLAYVGNTPNLADRKHGNHVDIIRAPRSSGSILKPFLYAAMLDKGILAPNQLQVDIPTRFGKFTPTNFSRDYDGAVRASEALARSLNVPAVKMLQQYGIEPFYGFLQKAGMTTLNNLPDHYGLSLILGGAETRLWDLAGMYASLARIVRNYEEEDGLYPLKPFQPLIWKSNDILNESPETTQPFLRASAAWLTIDALMKVVRPEEETGWESFAGAHHIAWKTGTSYGFRDGWAIGVTRDYVVAVWVGNAYGEGRPGLTGTAAASPLMFEIFGILPRSAPFSKPADELVPMPFCRHSGFMPSVYCAEIDTLQVPQGTHTGLCPYHQIIHLDREKQHRVSDKCYPVSEMESANWFVLPPVQEYYYRKKHPEYRALPPWSPNCYSEDLVMELIYPRELNRVFIPRQLDGTEGEIIFNLAHRDANKEVHWFVDQDFGGITKNFHQLGVRCEPGWHTITLVDENGNQLRKRFFVVQNE